MGKDQIPTFTVAEVRRFQDGKWGMPPAEVLLAQRLQEQDPTVQAAERVSVKFRELASVLQEWDTSAAEASKAFQDLQDTATWTPLDAEQVRKDASILASFHGVPREPWYKRLWSVFWDSRHDTVEESFARLHTSRKVLIDHFVDRIGGAPFRLWSWLRGTR